MFRDRPVVGWVLVSGLLVVALALSAVIGPGGWSGATSGLRWLRIALGLLAGGTLGLVGATLQGVLRNPLVDPFTLGVASGAAFGSTVAVSLGRGFGPLAPVGGFCGAAATILLVYLLARVRGRVTTTGLVLAGVIASFLLSSLTMLAVILGRRTIGEAVYVMMGHLGVIFTRPVLWLFAGGAVVVALGSAYLFSRARSYDVASLDEDSARSLGVDTARLTLVSFLVTSVMVGIVVSFTGAVSFVGLVVPHLARLFFGPTHGRVMAGSVVGGAALLLASDVAARNIVPGGLPLSVVTALVGVPFFVYLLRRGLR
ncbi:MAG: iron ABC transporter permease [bacterium]